MNLLSVLNNETENSNTAFDGTLIFPVGVLANLPAYFAWSPPINDNLNNSPVSIKNVFIDNDAINFDLSLFNVDKDEFPQLKIILLTQTKLDALFREQFPDKLTKTSMDLLFSTDKKQNVYEVKKELPGIHIKYNPEDGPIKILINLVSSSRFGMVNLFTLEKNRIPHEKVVSKFDFNYLAATNKLPAALKALKEQAYVSDLYYSYSSNGQFSGFYAIDAEKFINRYASFPNLISRDDIRQFSQFLFKSEFYLFEHDKDEGGYKLNRALGPALAVPVENVRVDFSGNKIFYNFLMLGVNSVPNYQAKLRFTFNDISLGLLKNKIQNLIRAMQNKDGQLIKDLASEVYGKNIPNEFKERLGQIDLLSNTSIHELAGEIIRDLKEQLRNSEQKTVSDNSLGSQYTFPLFNAPASLGITYEQNFDKIIILGRKKENGLVNFIQKNRLMQTDTRTFLPNFKTAETLETTVKKFIKARVPKITTIKEFSILSIKDESTETDNLKNNSDCGQIDEKSKEKITIVNPAKFLELVTTLREDIKFYYLDRTNETVSGFVFEELSESILLSLANDQKILVRLASTEDFYDSYFYVRG